MEKKDDKNIETIALEPRELTPFEKHAEGLAAAAYLMKIYQETAALIEKLDDLEGLQEDLPVPLELLEKMADEAIAGLANDLEERFGISA